MGRSSLAVSRVFVFSAPDVVSTCLWGIRGVQFGSCEFSTKGVEYHDNQS
jgi:hypothetical protein